MSKRRARITLKRPITGYVFLTIGVAIVVASVISWFAFPGWRQRPSGFWELIGVSAVGIIGIIKDGITIIHDIRDIHNEFNSSARSTINKKSEKIALNSIFQIGRQNLIAVGQKIVRLSGIYQLGKANKIEIDNINSKRRRKR
jgi:hypothetical protein